MKISFELDTNTLTPEEMVFLNRVIFKKQTDKFEGEPESIGTFIPTHTGMVAAISDNDIVELPEQPAVVPTKDGLAIVVPPAPPPVTVIPPPAPNTQEPAAVSTGTDAELDSDGVAWDPTIHSETRMKNANGTWRKRRTTKNVEVKQSIPGLEHLTPNSVPAPPSRKMVNTFVRINGAQELIKAPDGATDEELSAITGQPTVREDRYQATEQPQVTGYQPSAAPGSPIPPPPSGGSSVMPPPPPAAPPAPAAVKTAPQGAPAGTFAELMERVTKYFGSQSITTQDLVEVCNTFSIKSVQECYAQPALIPLVSNAIDEKVKARMGAA